MQVVPSTFIALLLMVWMMRRGAYHGLAIFCVAIPFGMMAAFNLPAIGNTTILATDMVLLAMAMMLLLHRNFVTDFGRLLTPGQPGLPLLGFLLYAILATAFFPRLFAGQTEVFSIGRVANQIGIIMSPLSPGGGNLSQLLRMILSLLAFAATAMIVMRRPDHRLVLRAMLAVTLAHAILGITDVLTQMTHTSWVMAPIRTANYSLTLGQEMAGLNRMIGGFPEASSYGYLSLGIFGFWLGYWFHDRSKSPMPLAMMLLTLFLVIRGTSSSAYVGAALLIAIFAALRMRDMSKGRSGLLDTRVAGALVVAVAGVPLLIMTAYLLYAMVPAFSDFVDRSLLTKLSSDSGVERMSWNIQALRNFWDTLTLGAGLGSVRASNWIAAVLGTTGLIGLGLLLTFLWRLFRTPIAHFDPATMQVAMALKMGLAGCMARALVVKATPNLDFIFFVMAGMLFGLSLGLPALRKSRRRRLLMKERVEWVT